MSAEPLGEVTLGEVSRNVQKLEGTVGTALAELRLQIQNLNVVHQDVYTVDRQYTDKRFIDLDQRFNNWRTGMFAVIGLLLTAAGLFVALTR